MSDEDDASVGRYEWERWVRRVRLHPSVKLVALTLATYANRDGTHMYPGVAKLAAVTGLTERSVRDALKTLRDLGLLERTREGFRNGRRALADEHEMRRPTDLEDRTHLLSPDESPDSIECDEGCGHARTPELTSPVRRRRKPKSEQEPRNSLPRSPEVSSGSPEVSSENPGSEFPPPTHDPASNHPIDQRGDHLRDATTEGRCATCDNHGDLAECCPDHPLPMCPGCLAMFAHPRLRSVS